MNIDIDKVKVYWTNNRNIRLRNMTHVDVIDYRLDDRNELLAQARRDGYMAVVFVDIRLMYKSFYEGSCDVWCLRTDNVFNPEEHETNHWHITWAKLKFKNMAVSPLGYEARCGVMFYRGSAIKLDSPDALEYCMLGFRKAYEQGKDYLTTNHLPPPR